jgi:hypothetical protein
MATPSPSQIWQAFYGVSPAATEATCEPTRRPDPKGASCTRCDDHNCYVDSLPMGMCWECRDWHRRTYGESG